jgi:nitrate/nitrite-specific signal transduction histidine kinase
MGLQVMRHRAEMIGGILDVRRGSSGGTELRCTFDIKSQGDKGEKEHG